MTLQVIDAAFSICKLPLSASVDFSLPFLFAAKTDHELSVVLPTRNASDKALARDDGWRAIRFAGTLDFSLIGILSRASTLLADHGISIFAVSTYDTDYILVREENLSQAIHLFRSGGYTVEA